MSPWLPAPMTQMLHAFESVKAPPSFRKEREKKDGAPAGRV